MLISYNWLKSYIPKLPKPEKISSIITSHICEVDGVEEKGSDTIFDLSILPDRAHDLLSHQGVARELASLLELEFKLPVYKIPKEVKSNLKIKIETDKCRRYMGRIIRNVKVGPSREWMVSYLESIGQRSINNIVDATNIVMFDSGQPIHAFDLSKLSGEKIVVKNGGEGEELELVGSDKVIVKLSGSETMITDGEKNLAVAGVKGGADSGVSDTTIDILIEVANFEPISTRNTSKKLKIQTDATKRYENDLSVNLCNSAMEEISSLLLEIFPNATFEEVVDIYPKKKEVKSISFTKEYISKMLGVEITDKEIEKILKNYNYKYTGNFTVEVPDMRVDLTGPYDMIEEIGRVYGYDKIPSIVPKIDFKTKDNIIWTEIAMAKDKLIEDGYKEIITYTFTNKGKVEILASASDKNFLRTNIIDGLKESINLNQKNLPLLGLDDIKIFEIGTVFKKDKEEIHVVYGNKKEAKEVLLDDFIKGLDIDSFILQDKNIIEGATFQEWSIYPFITRDISVWVPENINRDELSKIYKDLGTELLVTEPKLFDEFTKEGMTSYAFHLVFQSYIKTLTDNDINIIMSNIEKNISKRGWKVR